MNEKVSLSQMIKQYHCLNDVLCNTLLFVCCGFESGVNLSVTPKKLAPNRDQYSWALFGCKVISDQREPKVERTKKM